MKRLFFILLLFLAGVACFGQKEFNIWYFATEAGIDFNSGSPVVLTDGKLNQAQGCASICDSSGNILFYTGGITVFDASHDTMMNGDGLHGGFSSTHSATIVPKPGSCDIYYIFTNEHECNSNGLKYSEVDMSLNGGLGAVTAKNIPLYTPAAEKAAAVKHANGIDYWLVAHECLSDTFLVYLITSAGISPAPIKTGIGTVLTSDGHGQLKFSRDGSKLANAFQVLDTVDLFDFDKSTGTISNAISLGLPIGQAYGVEFSPDQSKLYVSQIGILDIYQFDLMAGNEAAINASITLIGNTGGAGRPGVQQLGPDNKIYIGKYGNGYLAVINDPDSLGAACNFMNNGFYLGGKTCSYGLPAIIPGYFGCGNAEGIQEGDGIEGEVKVYPNPANHKFTISGNFELPAVIELYDITGRKILNQNINSNQPIHISRLAKGLYLYLLNTDNKVIARGKVVIE